jgi:aspartyl-tRNA(Asn)/glutamyl-tRNA(Gln) amidotransferase subunit A
MDDYNKVFLMKNGLGDDNKPSAVRERVHVILSPSSISTAPTLQKCLPDRSKDNSEGVVEAYVNDVMTVPASLAGLPAITLPFGRSPTNGYPIGLQLVSQYGYDRFLLDISNRIMDQI